METLENNFKFAEDQMNEYGQLTPMLVVEAKKKEGEKTPVFVIPFTGNDMPSEKAAFIENAARQVRKFKDDGVFEEIDNIVFMAEAWMSIYEDKDNKIDLENPNVPMPRNDPKRIEAIFCTWSDMNGNTKMKAKKIKRFILPENPEQQFIMLEEFEKINDNNPTVAKNYLLEQFIREYSK